MNVETNRCSRHEGEAGPEAQASHEDKEHSLPGEPGHFDRAGTTPRTVEMFICPRRLGRGSIIPRPQDEDPALREEVEVEQHDLS
jgi:hypothetical protein